MQANRWNHAPTIHRPLQTATGCRKHIFHRTRLGTCNITHAGYEAGSTNEGHAYRYGFATIKPDQQVTGRRMEPCRVRHRCLPLRLGPTLTRLPEPIPILETYAGSGRQRVSTGECDDVEDPLAFAFRDRARSCPICVSFQWSSGSGLDASRTAFSSSPGENAGRPRAARNTEQKWQTAGNRHCDRIRAAHRSGQSSSTPTGPRRTDHGHRRPRVPSSLHQAPPSAPHTRKRFPVVHARFHEKRSPRKTRAAGTASAWSPLPVPTAGQRTMANEHPRMGQYGCVSL